MAAGIPGCVHPDAVDGDCVDHEHCMQGGTCSNAITDAQMRRRSARGYTIDDATGRRVVDGWDHDGDLTASLQGDLNRQRDAGDALTAAVDQYAADLTASNWEALLDAVQAWRAVR